jgi:hypothetical protein
MSHSTIIPALTLPRRAVFCLPMLSIFKKTPPKSPLKDHRRQWVEETFQQLTKTFHPQAIIGRKVLVPHYSDFPIRYNGDPQTAIDTLDIVASQMAIDPGEIELIIYDDTRNQLSTGSPTGGKLILGSESGGSTDSEPPAEEPWPERNEAGKVPLSLKQSRLKSPELMVANIARELAKIKLLEVEEARLTTLPGTPVVSGSPERDEALADCTTLIFGLGVFNANAAFMSQNLRLTGKGARMTQMEWGYGLALLAHLRNEKTPAWTEHLVKNIKSDFLKSEQYIAYHHRQ